MFHELSATRGLLQKTRNPRLNYAAFISPTSTAILFVFQPPPTPLATSLWLILGLFLIFGRLQSLSMVFLLSGLRLIWSSSHLTWRSSFLKREDITSYHRSSLKMILSSNLFFPGDQAVPQCLLGLLPLFYYGCCGFLKKEIQSWSARRQWYQLRWTGKHSAFR